MTLADARPNGIAWPRPLKGASVSEGHREKHHDAAQLWPSLARSRSRRSCRRGSSRGRPARSLTRETAMVPQVSTAR